MAVIVVQKSLNKNLPYAVIKINNDFSEDEIDKFDKLSDATIYAKSYGELNLIKTITNRVFPNFFDYKKLKVD